MDRQNAQPFQVGQVWKYNHRPFEPDSTLTIVKVDEVEAEPEPHRMIHIRLIGLNFKNPHTESGLQSVFPHLPFSEEAITASVTEKIDDEGDLGAFEEGYADWRTAFDAGKAGVWSLPVAETLDAIEQAVSASQR